MHPCVMRYDIEREREEEGDIYVVFAGFLHPVLLGSTKKSRIENYIL